MSQLNVLRVPPFWWRFCSVTSLGLLVAYIVFFLPIRPTVEVDGFLYLGYAIAVASAVGVAVLGLVYYLLRGELRLPRHVMAVITMMLVYCLSTVAWMLGGEAEGSAKQLTLVIAGSGLAVFGLVVGSLLPQIFSRAPRITATAMLTCILVLISRFLGQDSSMLLADIVISRFFVLQTAVIVFVLVWVVDFSNWRGARFLLACSVLSALILFSGTRSLLIAAVVFIVVARVKSWRRPSSIILISAAGAGFFVLLSSSLIQTTYGARAADGFFHDENRAAIRSSYFDILNAEPYAYLLGRGSEIGAANIVTSSDAVSMIQSPHNTYLFLLLSVGVVGTLAFGTLLYELYKIPQARAFILFLAVFGMANDILLFPVYSSQLVNLVMWYAMFGLYFGRVHSLRQHGLLRARSEQ